MTGNAYDKALALADNDPDILDEVHEILLQNGLSETAYAQIFMLLFYKTRSDDDRISCSSIQKLWKCGQQPLSDVKLFASLSQCCDLIRNYVLASWENCVLSAWTSKRELTKSMQTMTMLESLDHAKNIISAASKLMPSDECAPEINWTDEDSEEP